MKKGHFLKPGLENFLAVRPGPSLDKYAHIPKFQPLEKRGRPSKDPSLPQKFVSPPTRRWSIHNSWVFHSESRVLMVVRCDVRFGADVSTDARPSERTNSEYVEEWWRRWRRSRRSWREEGAHTETREERSQCSWVSEKGAWSKPTINSFYYVHFCDSAHFCNFAAWFFENLDFSTSFPSFSSKKHEKLIKHRNFWFNRCWKVLSERGVV